MTTSFAGLSRLWPAAVSLSDGVAWVAESRGVPVDDSVSSAPSQGKWLGSKGQSVVQTAKMSRSSSAHAMPDDQVLAFPLGLEAAVEGADGRIGPDGRPSHIPRLDTNNYEYE